MELDQKRAYDEDRFKQNTDENITYQTENQSGQRNNLGFYHYKPQEHEVIDYNYMTSNSLWNN